MIIALARSAGLDLNNVETSCFIPFHKKSVPLSSRRTWFSKWMVSLYFSLVLIYDRAWILLSLYSQFNHRCLRLFPSVCLIWFAARTLFLCSAFLQDVLVKFLVLLCILISSLSTKLYKIRQVDYALLTLSSALFLNVR